MNEKNVSNWKILYNASYFRQDGTTHHLSYIHNKYIIDWLIGSTNQMCPVFFIITFGQPKKTKIKLNATNNKISNTFDGNY